MLLLSSDGTRNTRWRGGSWELITLSSEEGWLSTDLVNDGSGIRDLSRNYTDSLRIWIFIRRVPAPHIYCYIEHCKSSFPILGSNDVITRCFGSSSPEQKGCLAIRMCLRRNHWTVHSRTFRKSDISHPGQTGNVCKGSCSSIQVWGLLSIPTYLLPNSNITSDSSAKLFFENSQSFLPGVTFF